MFDRSRPKSIWTRSGVKRVHTLVIHHTADTHAEQKHIVEASHQKRGYPESNYGSHIAYHFMVGKTGQVVQNRTLSERSGHTRNQAVNLESIAIVVAGNFEIEQPTREQIKALKSLIKRLDAIYHFDRIIPHRDASPTACPGKNLDIALKDVWRDAPQQAAKETGEQWNITRYYTPVRGQKRYFRTVSDKDFIHRVIAAGLIDTLPNGELWYSFASEPVLIGRNLTEADAWFNGRPEHKEAIRKELEYLADFKVNCSGDCFIPANGMDLRTVQPMTVVACPGDKKGTPEIEGYPFGTKFEIEGIGIVECVDRGGSIVGNRLDLYAGWGDEGLQRILTTKNAGLRHGKVLK